MGKNTDIAALQGTFIIMSTKRDCRFRMYGLNRRNLHLRMQEIKKPDFIRLSNVQHYKNGGGAGGIRTLGTGFASTFL